MAGIKNSLVLGCFILASVLAHAFLSGRYEGLSVFEGGDWSRTTYYRFDKLTGNYEVYGGLSEDSSWSTARVTGSLGKLGWLRITGPNGMKEIPKKGE